MEMGLQEYVIDVVFIVTRYLHRCYTPSLFYWRAVSPIAVATVNGESLVRRVCYVQQQPSNLVSRFPLIV
jgi:hypothetical protein